MKIQNMLKVLNNHKKDCNHCKYIFVCMQKDCILVYDLKRQLIF